MVHPSLDESKHCFEPGEGPFLVLGVFGQECSAAEKLLQGLRVGGVETFLKIHDRVGIDADSVGEVADGANQMKSQPPSVSEKPRVGNFPDGEINISLFHGNVEVSRKIAHILGHQQCMDVVFRGSMDQRDSNVTAGEHFLG